MKRIALTLALVLVVAACGDDDSSGTTTTAAPTTGGTTTAAPTTQAPTTTASPVTTAATTTAPPTTTVGSTEPMFEIASITFGEGPMLVITNVGGASGNLGGHWLCQRPSYFELPDVEVGPGESFAISLGGSVFLPPPGAITVEEQASVGGVSPGSGELGLYTSNSFGSAEDIISYVEWGAPGHGRSDTAVAAGIWTSGGFVETTDDTTLIDRTDFDTVGPDSWTSS